MDWKKTTAKIYNSARKPKKSRKFRGAYGFGFGPAFPMGQFDMSSVPGCSDGGSGMAADAGGDCGGACVGESVDREPVDIDMDDDITEEVDDLMMSDNDRLIYALRGIIENAKIAYEAVTGTEYDGDSSKEEE